ncbi:MAG: ADP-ribosylation factor-like protein [Promethearchaeota archaeon]
MSHGPLKISIIGLPGAGKTTIVHRLKFNTFLQRPKATIGVSAEIIELGDLRLVLWDVGGHALQALWQQYRKGTKGILYVIDGANKDRFLETQEQLKLIISDDYLENIPIAILVNKIDIAYQEIKKELIDALLPNEKDERVKIYQTSSKTGEGINDAMIWIKKHIEIPEIKL